MREAVAKSLAQVRLLVGHHSPGVGAFENQPDAMIRFELIATLTIGLIPMLLF